MAEPKEKQVTMAVEGAWNVGAYKYKGNRLLEEFTDNLKEKRIIGSLCPGCGKVIVPLRNLCGRCHIKMDKRQLVSEKGTITSFVISPPAEKGKYKILGLDPVETGVIGEGEVLIPVFVRFDGSDSNFHSILRGAEPEKVHVGMRVKAVWAEELKGAMSDLEAVEPLKEDETST